MVKILKKTAGAFVIYCVLLFIILIINAVSVSLFVIVPVFRSGSSGFSALQNEFVYFLMAGETNKATYALSAAIAVAGSTIGSGYAIAHVGTSAISAITEKEENFGKAFLIVSLAEALAIYGLIMGILLWTNI